MCCLMARKHVEPTTEGWYDDPEGRKGVERYWNGTAWSGAPREKARQLTGSAVAMMLIGTVVLAALVWWLIFT